MDPLSHILHLWEISVIISSFKVFTFLSGIPFACAEPPGLVPLLLSSPLLSISPSLTSPSPQIV